MSDKKIPTHTATLAIENKKSDGTTYSQYIELGTCYISEKNGTIPVRIPKGISVHGGSTILVSPLTEKRREIIEEAMKKKEEKQSTADDTDLPF